MQSNQTKLCRQSFPMPSKKSPGAGNGRTSPQLLDLGIQFGAIRAAQLTDNAQGLPFIHNMGIGAAVGCHLSFW